MLDVGTAEWRRALSRKCTNSSTVTLMPIVGGRESESRVSSVDEAKSLRTQMLSKQKRLRQVKREINLDMKRIRAEY